MINIEYLSDADVTAIIADAGMVSFKFFMGIKVFRKPVDGTPKIIGKGSTFLLKISPSIFPGFFY